ncbi:hypothetical protein ACMFMF_008371 [Clarireedia jacksonii]
MTDGMGWDGVTDGMEWVNWRFFKPRLRVVWMDRGREVGGVGWDVTRGIACVVMGWGRLKRMGSAVPFGIEVRHFFPFFFFFVNDCLLVVVYCFSQFPSI